MVNVLHSSQLEGTKMIYFECFQLHHFLTTTMTYLKQDHQLRFKDLN